MEAAVKAADFALDKAADGAAAAVAAPEVWPHRVVSEVNGFRPQGQRRGHC